MRILHTISGMSISSGGPTTCTYTLIKGLIDLEIDINILTFAPEKNDKLISEESFIQTIEIQNKTRFGYSNVFKIALKNHLNVDILHANGLWQYVGHITGIIARKNNIPFVLSPHGMLYPEALNKSKWIKKILLLLYQKADLEKATVLHATCYQELQHIRAMGIKTPIAVIPNPIEIQKHIIPEVKTNAIKRVGFVGRFAPIKNIENLIKAWALIGKDRPDWELILIGDGSIEYKTSLIKLAESLEIKNILFAGFLSGVAKEEMINSLSYVVLPSKSENFGMVVLESLIKEIPVIASKGTPWEELNTYNAGWWIESGVAPLFVALQKAMQLSESERQIMGHNGRLLVEEKYSIEIVARQMIQLYNWILNGGEKPEFVYN